jgi:hypothetical protein
MNGKEIHMAFRDVASLSLLAVAFEKSFPLFHLEPAGMAVDAGGKDARDKIFRTLKTFSTTFPHSAVDVIDQ